MTRYNIVFLDNTGNFSAIAIAESAGGVVISNTGGYDGQHDLAIIEFPSENTSYMDEMLDGDENVISYE